MSTLKDFFISDNLKKLLGKWIQEDYKNKPLCIYGKNGIGKTYLANCLLKEFKIININIDFIKINKDLKSYIDLSLGKKNICMMFSKKKNLNVYKALLLDDINIIQNLDKGLFKNIISWLKYINKYKDNPIIFILSDTSIVKKTFKEIIKVSLLFELKYTDNQFIKLITKLLNNEKILISNNHIKNILKQTGKNVSNVKSHIEFLPKKNIMDKNIDIIDKKDFSGEINTITYKIINDKFDIQNILSNSYSDYNIISLNLLDNIHKFFLLKNGDFLDDYLFIYKNICLGDKLNSDMIIEHNYELFDYILMQQILFPIYKIKQNFFKEIKEIQYNKYISKLIYYISNRNTFIKHNLDMNNVYYELFLYDSGSNKEKYIDKKILEKYIKIYNWIYNRSIKKNLLI